MVLDSVGNDRLIGRRQEDLRLPCDVGPESQREKLRAGQVLDALEGKNGVKDKPIIEIKLVKILNCKSDLVVFSIAVGVFNALG